jgi:surfactin synthase thioesterase subunit
MPEEILESKDMRFFDPGGHFFILAHREELVELITAKLRS